MLLEKLQQSDKEDTTPWQNWHRTSTHSSSTPGKIISQLECSLTVHDKSKIQIIFITHNQDSLLIFLSPYTHTYKHFLKHYFFPWMPSQTECTHTHLHRNMDALYIQRLSHEGCHHTKAAALRRVEEVDHCYCQAITWVHPGIDGRRCSAQQVPV